jgi:hypothetical protein
MPDICFVRFLDRTAIAVACVVHEDVDCTEPCLSLVDGLGDLSGVGDIQWQGNGLRTTARDMSATAVGSRAVTAAFQPRPSTSRASSRPKPVEQPVINQTGMASLV